MTLDADEFIRRFLFHVLPDGFQRIRYYGFLGNRYREEKLARCRQLLGMPACPNRPSEESQDYRDRYEELTGCSLRECPVCHQGRMVTIAILPPSPTRQTSITDTLMTTSLYPLIARDQLGRPSQRRSVATSGSKRSHASISSVRRASGTRLEALSRRPAARTSSAPDRTGIPANSETPIKTHSSDVSAAV